MFRDSSKISRTAQFPFPLQSPYCFIRTWKWLHESTHTTQLWLSRWAAQSVSSWKWCCCFSLYHQSHQQVTSPHSSSIVHMCVTQSWVLSHSVLSHCLWSHGLWSVRLFCPWGFSRQECWSGLPCPSPGDLPNAGIEPRCSTLQADSFWSEPPGKLIVNMEVLKSLSQSQHFSVKPWSETLYSRLNLIMWFTHTHLLLHPLVLYNPH